jgi:hypothetical protein
MSTAEPSQASGRETRLLLVTIVVSIAVLLLLARFRFPEETSQQQPVDPAPAPLQRLAARGAFDDLASAMADLERRIAPRVVVFRVQPGRPSGEFVVAPRVTADRAVLLLAPEETLSAAGEAEPAILTREFRHHLAILSVPSAEGAIVAPRTGSPRQGPRYVVAVEGTPLGPSLRPVYVGRLGSAQDTSGAQAVTLSGLQSPLPRGAAVFTFEGAFLGLVTETGTRTTLLLGEYLTIAAQDAQPTPITIGDFGIEVQDLTPALGRATRADRGVLVSFVRPDGPAAGILQPGDVILSLQDTTVGSTAGFRQAERGAGNLAEVPLSIVRAGEPLQVTLTPGPMQRPVHPTTSEPGIVGRTVTGVGIEVVAVQAGTAAAIADIRRGDLIVQLSSTSAPSLQVLDRAYRAAKPGDLLLLAVVRDQRQRLIAVEKR